jgi:hypothetical protein
LAFEYTTLSKGGGGNGDDTQARRCWAKVLEVMLSMVEALSFGNVAVDEDARLCVDSDGIGAVGGWSDRTTDGLRHRNRTTEEVWLS